MATQITITVQGQSGEAFSYPGDGGHVDLAALTSAAAGADRSVAYANNQAFADPADGSADVHNVATSANLVFTKPVVGKARAVRLTPNGASPVSFRTADGTIHFTLDGVAHTATTTDFGTNDDVKTEVAWTPATSGTLPIVQTAGDALALATASVVVQPSDYAAGLNHGHVAPSGQVVITITDLTTFLTGAATLSIDDGGAGGSFDHDTIAYADGATFTYTASASEAHVTITLAVDDGAAVSPAALHLWVTSHPPKPGGARFGQLRGTGVPRLHKGVM